jgi:hypothetical protein
MVNKRRILRIFASLGIKGILALVFLTTVTFALVTYTETVTVNPTQQLTVGATTASWTIYVNEIDQVRYLPGGFDEPTLSPSDPSTYSVKVVTDSNKVCAAKIELVSAVNSSKFSNFNITVRSSSGGAWSDEALYAGTTGGTTKTFIDGLVGGDAGYIHQAESTTKYYEIKVTYSYDLIDETSAVEVAFQFTPLPQDSFT